MPSYIAHYNVFAVGLLATDTQYCEIYNRYPVVVIVDNYTVNSASELVPIFTARCYASAVLAMALCPSVCLSVCLTQVGVLLKRLYAGSHEQHRTIAHGL